MDMDDYLGVMTEREQTGSYNLIGILIEWVMENDTLSRIISVEKEIQQHLELERTKAREWLEKEERAYESKLLEEEEKIEEDFNRRLEQVIREAESKASMLLEKAHAEAAGLEDLDEKYLTGIVMKYIVRVLPRGTP